MLYTPFGRNHRHGLNVQLRAPIIDHYHSTFILLSSSSLLKGLPWSQFRYHLSLCQSGIVIKGDIDLGWWWPLFHLSSHTEFDISHNGLADCWTSYYLKSADSLDKSLFEVENWNCRGWVSCEILVAIIPVQKFAEFHWFPWETFAVLWAAAVISDILINCCNLQPAELNLWIKDLCRQTVTT